jgi:hypothetical protein
MIGQIILHYTILEKLGEVPIRLDLSSEAKISPFAELRIPACRDSFYMAGRPTFFVGSRRRCI